MNLNDIETPVRCSQLIRQGSFEPEHHWYPKALNSTIHPMVDFFMNLNQHRIIQRYCHLHPMVKYSVLEQMLSYQPKYFRWAGADLIHVTTEQGLHQMVVIENNSCPSGQKSMPLLDGNQEQGGYRQLIEQTFCPLLHQRNMVNGGLAVIYDKNAMEASGYASVIADVMDEPVHFVPFYEVDEQPAVRFDKKGVMHIWGRDELWHPIRAAFRYITQRPWNRIPINSKTRLLNPIIACLAGGRNKMIAAKAYDIFNGEIAHTGLKIYTPETIWNVHKDQIPLWVKKMGGQAVIKIPYSNAGQGVFTVVNEAELEAFMKTESPYELFIVQSLIGNYQWSSSSSNGKFYHIGTMPNTRGESYVADLRFMVIATEQGIRPVSMYSRRAKRPLTDTIDSSVNSWDMLGTNLSIRRNATTWDTDAARLLLMDRWDFNKLGLGLDDLIEGYIQTVLSMIAIDKMAQMLMSSKGIFKKRLFRSLNDDTSLLSEIMG